MCFLQCSASVSSFNTSAGYSAFCWSGRPSSLSTGLCAACSSSSGSLCYSRLSTSGTGSHCSAWPSCCLHRPDNHVGASDTPSYQSACYCGSQQGHCTSKFNILCQAVLDPSHPKEAQFGVFTLHTHLIQLQLTTRYSGCIRTGKCCL